MDDLARSASNMLQRLHNEDLIEHDIVMDWYSERLYEIDAVEDEDVDLCEISKMI
jgi:hypothetical protein